jgi:hypothetical protein
VKTEQESGDAERSADPEAGEPLAFFHRVCS